MFLRPFQKNSGILRKSCMRFSQVPQRQSMDTPTIHKGVQFSKEKLIEFGELPFGQIPEAL